MHSAILPGYRQAGIHSNHMGMTKFGDKNDPGFRRVSQELQIWARQLETESGSPPVLPHEMPAVPKLTREAKDCLKSLSFPAMDDRRKDIDHESEGTCLWLFQHPIYKEWISQRPGLLWIKGKPGAGKSTILKHTLKRFQTRSPPNNNDVIISFFFHGRGAELQKRPLGLFRSFLYQLLNQLPDLLADLVQAFKKRCDTIGLPGEKWNWHPHELQDFFEASLRNILKRSPVAIFVDALDECGEETAVSLANYFQRVVQKLPTDSQLHICFTCCHYPILALDHGLEICVENENEHDIATFVKELLADKIIDSRIAEKITCRASGSFQWASLVIRRVLEFKRRGQSTKNIHNEIQRIPEDLNKLYIGLFERLDQEDRPESLKLMQWIYFSLRPLTLDELRFAMVVDADCSHQSLQMCQKADNYIEDVETMERKLTTLSRGLAEVRTLNNSRVVQFIHETVNDFFLHDGMQLLDSNWKSNDLAIGGAHHRLSRSCIRYINMDEIVQSEIEDRNRIESRFSYLSYATTSWVVHTVRAESKNISQANLMSYLKRPSLDLLRHWIRIYQFFGKYSNNCPSEGTTLLHLASKYNLRSLLLAILERLKTEPDDVEADSKDADGRTPLSWAAREGHETVVRLLMDRDDVEADSKDGNGRTPLSWAAREGHEAVVRLLVDRDDVEADSKDADGRTPLPWAAWEGHEAVVRLLVDRDDVEADSKNVDGRTPLSQAAWEGHETVVRLLVDRDDIEAGSKDADGRTPLSQAAWEGHETVVRLLVDRNDVEAGSKDGNGRTPLSWAAWGGHEAVVRLLTDRSNFNRETSHISPMNKHPRTSAHTIPTHHLHLWLYYIP